MGEAQDTGKSLYPGCHTELFQTWMCLSCRGCLLLLAVVVVVKPSSSLAPALLVRAPCLQLMVLEWTRADRAPATTTHTRGSKRGDPI